jgi:hypothetical protein
MTTHTGLALLLLHRNINARLDKLHDELIARLRTMARSTGQRMRVVKAKKSGGASYE